MAKQCALVIGYLLPRRCEEKVANVCQNCNRGVCELHVRIGDQGLLCRDCFEEGQPRDPELLHPLPERVSEAIYTREEFGYFDSESDDDAFSTLS